MFEHRLLGSVLEEMWVRQRTPVAVLHAEIDTTGYDVILDTEDNRTRYLQLKASLKSRSTQNPQELNPRLWDRPWGCLIWTLYDVAGRDKLHLRYLWLRCSRDAAGNPLGMRNTPLRLTPKGRVRVKPTDCVQLTTMRQLVRALFPIPDEQ